MTYIDHHVHTNFSPDSKADIGEYIKRAKELDMEYILFTDHKDFGSIDPKFEFFIDYDEYFKTMKELEIKHNFPIKIGIEIGYKEKLKNEIEDFLNKYDFDFIIASIHYGHSLDFYNGDFFEGKTKEEAYLDYFKLLLNMVENFNCYDVVGHLDFIERYAPYEDSGYLYSDYNDVIDKILKTIIKSNRGIEVNTSGLRQGQGRPFPKFEVIKRYKELGGEIITVGSDSHFNEDFQAHVKELVEELKFLGFEPYQI